MSDPESLSLGIVVMGEPINQVVYRMVVAALLDATLRTDVFDGTNSKMITTSSSQFGFKKSFSKQQ
jgi:hypothetical protein